ncbi:ATP-dependent DNA helicase Rep [uncultured archaeon]|nr:ATP-dependent DNA helicase Rep [uncultured archaeon]
MFTFVNFEYTMLRISTIEIEKLEEILSEIQRKKLFHIIPNKEEDNYIQNLRNKIEDSNEEIKNILCNINNIDTYLIHSVRENLLLKLDQYHHILQFLKIEQNIFKFKFSNELVENSINKVIESKKLIENFNQELIERRKKEYASLFLESDIIFDDNQKRAIITDDKHNLVVAGAGSGKTEVLITRIAYLTRRKQEPISPNRIIVLTFQKTAAKEIEKRIYRKFGISIKIQTFHSLGYEILNNSSFKKKLKFDGDNFDFDYKKFINDLYKKAEKDPSFQNKLITYEKFFGDDDPLKKESSFETKEEWYKYIRNFSYVALNGRKVKSKGEKAIMNFLLTHKINGTYIEVRYEDSAEWMKYTNVTNKIIIPKPDFFLPRYNMYIEHWAMDEKGNVPEWFEKPKEYKKDMQQKIERFKRQKNYSLLETTYSEFRRKDFIEQFENKFIAEIKRKNPEKEVVLSSISYSELVDIVWRTFKDSIKRIPFEVATFIIKAKTNGLKPQDIHERLMKESWSPKQKAFGEIALIIYSEYEKELQNRNEIDFCDMINQAVEELQKNSSLYENSFDHILIDEYQDISKQRYQLIKVLMTKNSNSKLFCVGDDWQSIMGFTGSNLELFIKFHNYFDHPARTDLLINYRSIKSIVDAGADLIENNGNRQLKKTTIAKYNDEKKIMVYSSSTGDKRTYYQQTAIHCANTIKEYLMKGYKPQDIMILCRIISKPDLINPLFKYSKANKVFLTINSHNPQSVPLMSVHKSKGLQAKVVLVLSVDKDLYGFPCEIENPLIFEPAMDTKYNNKEEEERRLFYVAITRSKEDVIIYTQKGAESIFLEEIKKHTEIKELDYKIINNP